MPEQEATPPIATVAARARVDDLRLSMAATADEDARARLRVRLVDMLAVLGDAPAALAELKQAAEGPASAGVLLALRAAAPLLPPDQVRQLRDLVRQRHPRDDGSASSSEARPLPETAGRVAYARGDAPSGPAAASVPVPAPLAAAVAVTSARLDPAAEAFAALAQGKPVRAARLGEEAARIAGAAAATGAATGGEGEANRLRDLAAALQSAGAIRPSLALARTLLEPDEPAAHPRPAAAAAGDGGAADLAALIDRANRLGESGLAGRWRADLATTAAPRRPPPVAQARRDAVAARRFEAVRRAELLRTNDAGAAAPVRHTPSPSRTTPTLRDQLYSIVPARAGLPALPAAQLWRVAYDEEVRPRARARLALRWADAASKAGEGADAAAVLTRAIDELPLDLAAPLRRARLDLLRQSHDDTALERVLDADAQVAQGAERASLRGEQARLLDTLGDPDGALQVRLNALADTPADPALLVPARQRLEGLGRLDRSLELASAAIPHLGANDRAARAGLLRDVATLSEAAAGNPAAAAQAWLDVLALYPGDGAAFEAAERLLRQLGDHDRLGTLLAWSATREEEPLPRAAALWRLAEFRRTLRDDVLGALPLYREILDLQRAAGPAAERASTFGLKEEDWQRRDDLLAVHTARALAAPTAAGRRRRPGGPRRSTGRGGPPGRGGPGPRAGAGPGPRRRARRRGVGAAVPAARRPSWPARALAGSGG